jgi:hypothetical protein
MLKKYFEAGLNLKGGKIQLHLIAVMLFFHTECGKTSSEELLLGGTSHPIN